MSRYVGVQLVGAGYGRQAMVRSGESGFAVAWQASLGKLRRGGVRYVTFWRVQVSQGRQVLFRRVGPRLVMLRPGLAG